MTLCHCIVSASVIVSRRRKFKTRQKSKQQQNILGRKTAFPVKFQLRGFVPLTTEKWGYKEKTVWTQQNY